MQSNDILEYCPDNLPDTVLETAGAKAEFQFIASCKSIALYTLLAKMFGYLYARKCLCQAPFAELLFFEKIRDAHGGRQTAVFLLDRVSPLVFGAERSILRFARRADDNFHKTSA